MCYLTFEIRVNKCDNKFFYHNVASQLKNAIKISSLLITVDHTAFDKTLPYRLIAFFTCD